MLKKKGGGISIKQTHMGLFPEHFEKIWKHASGDIVYLFFHPSFILSISILPFIQGQVMLCDVMHGDSWSLHFLELVKKKPTENVSAYSTAVEKVLL